MAFINLRLDLFWHKKEAAMSTVCLTGFPCRFFWFFVVAYKARLFGSLFIYTPLSLFNEVTLTLEQCRIYALATFSILPCF